MPPSIPPSPAVSADDMGLGKTLTVIALILAQKQKKSKEEGKDEEDQKLQSWISKNGKNTAALTHYIPLCHSTVLSFYYLSLHW